jgi:hypothetical protein
MMTLFTGDPEEDKSIQEEAAESAEAETEADDAGDETPEP